MFMSNIGISKRSATFQFSRRLIARLTFLLGLLWLPIGYGTTIQKLDIDDVVMEAELVFEGEVLTHEVRVDSNSNLINTFVTFLVLDVIKGNNQIDTLELKFAGGTLNGETVRINGLSIPQPGEQGIYFVESTSNKLINPLVGWSQGHFVIKESEGQRMVYTNTLKPVVGIQSVSSIPLTIKRPNTILEGNTAATGILVDSEGQLRRQPLQVNQLKSEILEMSR
ncbi:MAG: hypothetical protein CMQ26_08880 [Gammaproteobacteria bacterium]|nr:hypothetical protein [Gammaproteobacteria bacterium]